VAAHNHVLPPQYQQSDDLQPRAISTIPAVWRPITTCYLHSTSNVMTYNHMLPPQYQQLIPHEHVLSPQYQQGDNLQPHVTSTILAVWRPTTTCYLHSTSNVVAYNHVFLPQYQQSDKLLYNHGLPAQHQQCGGLQPRVTSTVPAVWQPTTKCYLHSTSSVAAYNQVLPPQCQQCGGLQ
ncbi:hypothetical protein Hamer_G003213, partial [Homarus americanus]